MDEPARIRAISATLLPDCLIEIELDMPGWDEPLLTYTDQSTDFLTRVGGEPRPIDLEAGDRTDELAREHIARHIRQIERRIEMQQRYEQRRQAQEPSVSDYEPYAC